MAKEMVWEQRSRACWLKNGDKNTSFFHRKASQRQKTNSIDRLKDDAGLWFEDEDDIAKVLTGFFSELFTSSNPQNVEDFTNLVHGRLDDNMRQVLQGDFTAEEVSSALHQMHPTKAPGEDGNSAIFYQTFWHIIGDDVTRLVLHILNNGGDPTPINKTLIALIPKIKKPTHAGEFRPISLCNVLFKIVTKTIANRLKLILPQIVDETQSAFVPNRLITDNALIALECFHHMKCKKKGREGFMALKLDMSKAYDRVEWSFLNSTLSSMGFPTKWTDLIMKCVSTVSFSVIVNGNRSTTFVPQRGLRQGDPLSPYLFILCVETLSASILRAVESNSIHGLKICPQAPMITHLFFADDSIIFCRSTPEEASHMASILKDYESASGQRINLHKSELSCSRNVLSTRTNELQTLLGVKAVERQGKYLGLPALVGRSKTQVFQFVRERVWKKLKGWKEKALSKAGREILIKAVVQAIPTYVMSCFQLPMSLCNEIERLTARFFWGGEPDKRKIHWLRWGKLTRSKHEGGLGFRMTKAFNKALLGKQWWRLINDEHALVSRVLKARYFPRTSPLQATKAHNPSFSWSSIMSAKSMISEGSCWRIGDGQSVHIWGDKWLPNTLDNTLHWISDEPSDVSLRVCAIIDQQLRNWDINKMQQLFPPEVINQIIAIPLRRGLSSDHLIWKHTKDGLYTVKSGYRQTMKMIHSDQASTSTPPGDLCEKTFATVKCLLNHTVQDAEKTRKQSSILCYSVRK